MDVFGLMNNNKVLSGIAMIIMNFGSRFVVGDLTTFQEEVLKSEVAKKIILWCIFFVATRDVLVAAMLTFGFYIVVKGLLNEHKRYNLLGLIMRPYDEMNGKYEQLVKMLQTQSVF